MGKEEAIEAIAEVDALVVADTRANEVEKLELMRGKLSAPVFPRLLVDVVLSPLTRYRCRKQDQGAVSYQIGDKRIGAAGIEMFRHFEALHQVELPPERKRDRHVERLEGGPRNDQLLRIDIVPIHTDHVR